MQNNARPNPLLPKPGGAFAANAPSAASLRVPLMLMLILALVIAGGGYALFERLQQNETRRIQDNLVSIAQLKSDQITGWLSQSAIDAAVLAYNSGISERIDRWLEKGGRADDDARRLSGRFKELKALYALGELTVTDASGNSLISTAQRLPDMSRDISLLRQAMNERQTVFGELRWQSAPDGTPYIGLPMAAPLMSGNGNLVGTLLFELDMNQYLFPTIQKWPVSSETAETILVKKDADDALILNELRNRSGTALTMRVPLDQTNRLATQAPAGKTGFIRGIDYKGEPGIGYALAVPGTDWFIVAKMDDTEAYAPIRRMAMAVTASALALLILSSALLHQWWRQRFARFQAAQLQYELNQQFLSEQYETVSKYANDIILLLDRHYTIVDANDRAEEAFGYSRQKLIGMSLLDLRMPHDKEGLDKRWAEILQKMSLVFESAMTRSDGTTFPVEVSARVIEKGNEVFVQSNLRDITERKRAQEREQRLRNMYRAVAAMDNAIVRLDSEPELFPLACIIAVEYGGMKLAWIGIPDETGRVAPVANYGEPVDYLNQIVVSVSADEPEGQGPIGKAFRSQKAVVAHDFADDESSAPWAEKVKQYGLHSASAFPITRSGKPYAIFTLYSESNQTFDEEIVPLLSNMAANLSFALDNLDREAERRRSDAEIRALFENASDGIYIFNQNGQIIDVNERGAQLLSCPRETLLTLGVIDVLPRHERRRLPVESARLSKDASVLSEWKIQCRDGPAITGEVSVKVLPDDRIMAMVRDVTERRRMEDDLRESERRFRQLADAMPQLVWSANADGNVDYFNERQEEYINVTKKENGEYEWALMIHPDDLELTVRRWSESLRTGNVFQIEHRLLRTNGSYRWHINRGVPIRNAQGAITKWYGTATDIHDLKLAQEKAAQNEERLRLAQQVTRIGTFDWDIKNNINVWSPEAEALYGFRPGDFGSTYETWAARLHPEDRERAEQEVKEGIEQGHYESEFRIIWTDGSVRWIAARGQTLKDEAGRPLRMVGVNIDDTRRKRAEEERTEYLRQLEAVLENLAEGVVIFDGNGNVHSMNPAALTIHGLADMDSAKRHLTEFERDFDLLDSNDKLIPIAYWPLSRVLKGEHFADFEVCVRNKSTGKNIYVAYSGSPITDDRNRVYLGVLTLRDVSERRHTEESLRLAALVFQESTEAMMVTDEGNLIVSVNPAFERLTGYKEEEITGKNPLMLSAGKESRGHYREMLKILTVKNYWQGELWLRKKSGDDFVAAMTVNATLKPDGSTDRHVALFSDVTQKKLADELVWQQANFDALTGLPNRRHFIDELHREIRESRRSRLPLALLFMDLDGFKHVNDTLGHEAGDLLLKEAAERLKRCVRETDTVARLGGDEFTIILGEVHNIRHVEKVARHILHQLSEPFELGAEIAHVTGSVGITLYPQDASSMDDLLINADQAMYAAKEAGKNRYSFFTAEMQQAAQERTWLLNELRVAIDKHQFKLVYQPIVELSTGCVNKAEALLRWEHPERGLIDPAVFIPIAEESGMIQEIGDWVFMEAATQAVKWRQAHHPDFQISINKSPIQFKARESDVARWLQTLKNLELPGQAIAVEITEGVLMDESKAVTDQLLAFRDAGIEVSLDDFGTGYSSLSYLKRFDIDRLKIDQTFVRDLETNSNDQALCEAMIVMGHKLGIKVIAEGVETDGQRNLLTSAGCDFAQGFLLSSPVPADELDILLKKGATYCPGMSNA